jgi:hypothetical protein
MPQIRPRQLDDSDIPDIYSSDSDESYESDVSADLETDSGDDDRAWFNTRNDVGDNCHQSKVLVLDWHPDAEKSLRQTYGSRSRATSYRQKKRQVSLQREESQHCLIARPRLGIPPPSFPAPGDVMLLNIFPIASPMLTPRTICGLESIQTSPSLACGSARLTFSLLRTLRRLVGHHPYRRYYTPSDPRSLQRRPRQ